MYKFNKQIRSIIYCFSFSEEVRLNDVQAAAAQLDNPSKFESLADKFYMKKKAEQEKSSEFKAFRALKVMLEYKDSDGLDWWRKYESTFPHLARIARRFLGIPASSAPSERVFSKYSIIWEKRKCNLKPETANDIVYLHELRRNRDARPEQQEQEDN
jgi:hypothetical protein